MTTLVTERQNNTPGFQEGEVSGAAVTFELAPMGEIVCQKTHWKETFLNGKKGI